ncbi:EboA domain-containing protein [uncultured Maribacter sp.]|uniref:EboA domain-containing protein n=1 Tax=uncultured Maribacter sp. TaxID=431308 RepID=UPI0030ED0205|tara:strand:+ start:14938 stop:15786 length:849 start_codon:yes stop_codon:yes gene_type:complete
MRNQEEIQNILIKYGTPESLAWLKGEIVKMAKSKSSKDLFMTYSLLNVKFNSLTPIPFEKVVDESFIYFKAHKANLLQVARIFLLSEILGQDEEFYTSKVANIIQVADTGELETFLKYLVLLPNPEAYKQTAVEALRTNIAIIFDAISLNNPYPAKYFNDQQWNQMYLKAAFMERDLSKIESVDERANEDLTRIISDYAHERWAASRKIDPMFWRPVSKFLNEDRLKDMDRLLSSEDTIENKAGALCCYNSNNDKAMALLNNYPELKHKVADGQINWNSIKL